MNVECIVCLHGKNDFYNVEVIRTPTARGQGCFVGL